MENNGKDGEKKGGLVLVLERFSCVYREVLPLLTANFEESGKWREGVTFDPDLDMYNSLDRSGDLLTFVLRRDGQAVGHIIYFKAPHQHMKTLNVAVNDTIYLVPEVRTLRLFLACVRLAEEVLSQLGVQEVRYGAPIEGRFGKLLEKFGYLKNQIEYHKVL